MGGFAITGDYVSRHGAVTPHDLSAPPRYPVDIRSQPTPHVSPQEHCFLDLYHAIGPTGVLVLKSLAYLTGEGRGAGVQVSRETLARHCARSIRTVSRAVARLKACQLTEAAQPPPQGFDCWRPNVYRLTPLGLHIAALLGSGRDDLPAWDSPGAPVFAQRDYTITLVKTGEPTMAHAAKRRGLVPPAEELPPGVSRGAALPAAAPPELAPLSPPILPVLDPDLAPLVRALESADPIRFAHLPDWVQAKLRAGVSRPHLRATLAALTAQRKGVHSWAGWLQQRLEELRKTERDSARVHARMLADLTSWKQQWAAWEQERAVREPGSLSLMALVAAARQQERGARRKECGTQS